MKPILTIAFLCLLAITLQAQQPFKDTNGKYGLKDDTGTIIIFGKYDDIEVFAEV